MIHDSQKTIRPRLHWFEVVLAIGALGSIATMLAVVLVIAVQGCVK